MQSKGSSSRQHGECTPQAEVPVSGIVGSPFVARAFEALARTHRIPQQNVIGSILLYQGKQEERVTRGPFQRSSLLTALSGAFGSRVMEKRKPEIFGGS